MVSRKMQELQKLFTVARSQVQLFKTYRLAVILLLLHFIEVPYKVTPSCCFSFSIPDRELSWSASFRLYDLPSHSLQYEPVTVPSILTVSRLRYTVHLHPVSVPLVSSQKRVPPLHSLTAAATLLLLVPKVLYMLDFCKCHTTNILRSASEEERERVIQEAH